MSGRQPKIDPEFERTDQLLDIWSRDRWDDGGGGGLHPLEVMRLLNEDQVVGEQVSNDEVMIIVDQSVLRAPPRIKALLNTWYKTYAPAEVKAKRLRISRSALYVEWKVALSHIRGTLRARGLAV